VRVGHRTARRLNRPDLADGRRDECGGAGKTNGATPGALSGGRGFRDHAVRVVFDARVSS
jgi:hypothetical protein